METANYLYSNQYRKALLIFSFADFTQGTENIGDLKSPCKETTHRLMINAHRKAFSWFFPLAYNMAISF